MVQTVKFSQFASGGTTVLGSQLAGLNAGVNALYTSPPQFLLSGTTAQRPVSPSDGNIRYNTTLKQFEFWNATSASWAQMYDSVSVVLGTAAFKNVSDNTKPTVPSLTGSFTVGHTAVFADTSGTIVDSGSPAGTGTVQSVGTGTGLTGGPITVSGTISFAAIAANSFWANTTGGVAVPAVTPITTFGAALLADADAAAGRITLGLGTAAVKAASDNGQATLASVSGAITSGHVAIFADTSGTVSDGGAQTFGTVTSVGSGAGLTGGPITTTGTLALAAIADHTLLANISGGALAPSSTTLTALIDNAIGNTQGDILYRNATQWVVLPPGTAGQVLQTGGAAANPSWVNGSTGSVTSISSGTGIVLTPDPIVSTGSVALNTAAMPSFTMTGDIAMGSNYITGLHDPSAAQDAATKNYVDQTSLNGTSVYAASAATLGTVTQSGSGVGATLTNAGTQATFELDGVNPPVGSNVLIKNTATGMTAANEGIYTVSNAGSGATNWVLTRATSYDTPTEINNTGLIVIQNGSTLAGQAWYNTATIVAVDTTSFNFARFGQAKEFSVVTQTFTSSGTYTPTSGMVSCWVRQVGGGGSSGGVADTTGGGAGASNGAGGGEYAEGIFTAADIGASQTVTIGAGGTAPSAGNNAGNTGGTTSLGSLMTAIGGSGSGGSDSTVAVSYSVQGRGTPGAGGTGGTGGDLHIAGETGRVGQLGQNATFGLYVQGGDGGNSQLGMGGAGANNTTGSSGTGYGSGAGGSSKVQSAAIAGTAGNDGYMIIHEYIYS